MLMKEILNNTEYNKEILFSKLLIVSLYYEEDLT